MKCPVCNTEMTEQDMGEVLVDVCEDGCKGMWFDWSELMKLDEKNEGVGEALKAALSYLRTNDGRDPIDCPKCGIPMHVHKNASNKEVNIDECYSCGGFFLDSGELKEIRENSMTEEEREAYVNKLIEDMPEYARGREDLEKKQARIAALDKFTRYLRLSYYI